MECPIYAPRWKIEEIADELKIYNIQITALQEMRWPHDGWIRKKNYALLYSGIKILRGNMEQGSLSQVVRHNAY